MLQVFGCASQTATATKRIHCCNYTIKKNPMVSDRALRKKSPVNAAVQIRKLIYVVCIFGAGPGK